MTLNDWLPGDQESLDDRAATPASFGTIEAPPEAQ
jgi:hypothetical protein